MKRKTILALTLLVAVVGLSSNALSENQTIPSNETANFQENLSAPAQVGVFPNVPSANLKVAFIIPQNGSKYIWNTTMFARTARWIGQAPNPAWVYAAIKNTGMDLKFDVFATTLDVTTATGRTPPAFLGRVGPNGDGLIVFGRFNGIMIKAEAGQPDKSAQGEFEMQGWPQPVGF